MQTVLWTHVLKVEMQRVWRHATPAITGTVSSAAPLVDEDSQSSDRPQGGNA